MLGARMISRLIVWSVSVLGNDWTMPRCDWRKTVLDCVGGLTRADSQWAMRVSQKSMQFITASLTRKVGCGVGLAARLMTRHTNHTLLWHWCSSAPCLFLVPSLQDLEDLKVTSSSEAHIDLKMSLRAAGLVNSIS